MLQVPPEITDRWLREFYRSPEWLLVRKQALLLANYQCDRTKGGCGANVFGKKRAHVDHIKSVRRFPELRLILSNLRVLCIPCHNRRHTLDRVSLAKQGAGLDGWPLGPQHPWNLPEREA